MIASIYVVTYHMSNSNVSQLDFPNENVYGMYQSHDWLAKFFSDDAGASRELNGVDASKAASNPNSGKDGTVPVTFVVEEEI